MTDDSTGTTPATTPKIWLLVLEFALLFVCAPLALSCGSLHLPLLPALWAVMSYCLCQLWLHPTFDRRLLWNIRPLRSQLVSIFFLFIVAATGFAIAIHVLRPSLLFNFVRRTPGVWAVVMLLYP